jgi:hypothetical protein
MKDMYSKGSMVADDFRQAWRTFKPNKDNFVQRKINNENAAELLGLDKARSDELLEKADAVIELAERRYENEMAISATKSGMDFFSHDGWRFAICCIPFVGWALSFWLDDSIGYTRDAAVLEAGYTKRAILKEQDVLDKKDSRIGDEGHDISRSEIINKHAEAGIKHGREKAVADKAKPLQAQAESSKTTKQLVSSVGKLLNVKYGVKIDSLDKTTKELLENYDLSTATRTKIKNIITSISTAVETQIGGSKFDSGKGQTISAAQLTNAAVTAFNTAPPMPKTLHGRIAEGLLALKRANLAAPSVIAARDPVAFSTQLEVEMRASPLIAGAAQVPGTPCTAVQIREAIAATLQIIAPDMRYSDQTNARLRTAILDAIPGVLANPDTASLDERMKEAIYNGVVKCALQTRKNLMHAVQDRGAAGQLDSSLSVVNHDFAPAAGAAAAVVGHPLDFRTAPDKQSMVKIAGQVIDLDTCLIAPVAAGRGAAVPAWGAADCTIDVTKAVVEALAARHAGGFDQGERELLREILDPEAKASYVSATPGGQDNLNTAMNVIRENWDKAMQVQENKLAEKASEVKPKHGSKQLKTTALVEAGEAALLSKVASSEALRRGGLGV